MSGVRFSRVLSRRAILAGAALALLAGPSAAPLAHAAAPSPMELMARAVSRAHSLTMTIVQKTTGPAASGGGMSTTMQEVAVRQGKTFAVYMVLTQRTANGTVTMLQAVHTAAHVCIRLGAMMPWQCVTQLPGNLASLVNMGPDQMAKRLGIAGMHIAPAGTRVVRGQLCSGYSFSYTVMGIRSHGTLWLSVATTRPVQQVSVTSLPLRKGSTPVVSTMTVTWSHWNDPALRIPAVS